MRNRLQYQWAEFRQGLPQAGRVVLVWLAIALALIAVYAFAQWSSGPAGHDDGIACDYSRQGVEHC